MIENKRPVNNIFCLQAALWWDVFHLKATSLVWPHARLWLWCALFHCLQWFEVWWMCRLMHRFWTAQEFAFFQLEGLFKSPVEISSKSMLGFSTSHHTSNHRFARMSVLHVPSSAFIAFLLYINHFAVVALPVLILKTKFSAMKQGPSLRFVNH